MRRDDLSSTGHHRVCAPGTGHLPAGLVAPRRSWQSTSWVRVATVRLLLPNLAPVIRVRRGGHRDLRRRLGHERKTGQGKWRRWSSPPPMFGERATPPHRVDHCRPRRGSWLTLPITLVILQLFVTVGTISRAWGGSPSSRPGRDDACAHRGRCSIASTWPGLGLVPVEVAPCKLAIGLIAAGPACSVPPACSPPPMARIGVQWPPLQGRCGCSQ
jgi:hypothetical protein